MIRPALLTLALLIAGCDDAMPIAAPPAPPTFGDATIRGTVRYVGAPPPLKMIDVAATCREARPVQEETIVVSRAGGLRDVVVSLDDAPASAGDALPPPTLDQVGCRYEPHVVAVQVGQPLRIRSSDPEFHNVHWTHGANPGDNLSFPRAGESRLVKFAAPEAIRMRCDVHRWMESWVAVVPNPFFAVTDAGGGFTIARVPAGTYRAKAWHPLLGERTAAVTVDAAGTATLDFAYARP